MPAVVTPSVSGDKTIREAGPASKNELAKPIQTKENDSETEKKIWIKSETMALLDLYKENMEFENKKCKTKKEMWFSMSKALAEEDIHATGHQCDSSVETSWQHIKIEKG